MYRKNGGNREHATIKSNGGRSIESVVLLRTMRGILYQICCYDKGASKDCKKIRTHYSMQYTV